ncbi:hypothetical protein A2276_06280 [candidate division WOR-1 bacterium RIFOXYA12_FULL_43_27]|uniref:Uncharacterized protein n=1 Tax=candidate division WOR-1 bacterium RIFOXYC2_FULL_46_14 TaxID=1802587 RepID=A0A1F4U5F7_UNCSA|nr:MAG: hypothetical protein A2276_06280 [candidate division WOR-1 bacterium RIFOXYA12_FULL_43_27]OGC20260.1 MAG: hypothetical protein A2292_04280 [candidate division WOR-1 bacterium RIFOXYB2_FULL_46_45]OGC32003.1 MAG: hypothetical protein A2232_07170 [candidate division WOR-1 bacterium RIFOXYA2_FULL_46_56]OGC40107.1 MAG: hypothetical protein A2438_02300 [candidate division WOR-1 bacterium RIFOXYC2_FULL_46_14]
MAWRIKYSNHLRERIRLRELPYNLAKDVLIFAVERYYDTATHYLVAVGKNKYKKKMRDLAVIYREDAASKILEAITIHPLKHGQKENRIKTGRWTRK